MKRRSFVKGLGSAFGGLGLRSFARGGEPGKSRRPNVLFIFPDQWRAQALGCMGNRDIQTPHVDRLASQGVLFRNAIANTPVCCPARANVLTGTYASRNGMVANDLRLAEATVTMADLYSHAGYRTGFIGKWHLDGGPRLPGFVPPGRRRHGFQQWAANECNHDYFHGMYFRDQNAPITENRYEPEYWTDLGIEFLNKAQQEPFFLMLAYGTPHNPYIAPEPYQSLYHPETLKMEPNWVAGTRGEEGASRKDIAGYYASITAVDDQIGRLLDALHRLGLDESTVVVFSSDHGDMLGSLGRTAKRTPWEESIRIPAIVRHTGTIPPHRKVTTLFSHVDFAPTLLSLCGLPLPAGLQGVDLSRVVLGETEEGPTAVYLQIFGPYHSADLEGGWRGIRTERYLYARQQSGPWLLYDLKEDPYEMNNLIGRASSRSLADQLDARLLKVMTELGDSWAIDWTDPLEDDGRLYKYRTFYTVKEYLAWARKHPQLSNIGRP